MSLRLSDAGVLDHLVLKGALAVQIGDAQIGMASDFPCTVSALRASDGKAVKDAVPHVSGVSGFLTLRTGSYQILVQPLSSAYLPSLRSATITGGGPPQFLNAFLRPSPSYSPLPNSIVLRGTLQWGPASPPPTASLAPVRWALVFATLTLSGTTTVVATAWTRSNAKGEFLLPLTGQPPSSDGAPTLVSARVEIYANPAPPPADPNTLADLPLDDDATLLTAQALARTLLESGLSAGTELSMNQDNYSFTPPGGSPVDNSVILL